MANFEHTLIFDYQLLVPQIIQIIEQTEIFHLWLDDDTLTPEIAQDIEHDLKEFDRRLWMLAGKINPRIRTSNGRGCHFGQAKAMVQSELVKIKELIG